MTWQWAEGAIGEMADKMALSVYQSREDNGVEKEKIGIDQLDLPGLHAFEKADIKVANGWPAISCARVVKTIDEIEQQYMSAASVMRPCGTSSKSG